ncbi:MAG TPA: hypothetical protein PLN38_17670, partial [Chitinophagales bacterium]|nr:hypothetical protein [Chitinophagales bacterium]
MTVEISIVVPSIRTENLNKVYDSICQSTKREFELIVAGPYALPERLQTLKNVKYVKELGSPVRASQIASTLCEGKLFTHIADDGMLLPNALDESIDLLYKMGEDKKNVVVAKYFEGVNGTNKPLQPDNYFKLNGSDWTSSPYIGDWWLFNVCVMYTEFFDELGGWDCSYEGTFYAHADLAVRAQFYGANVKMCDIPFADCDHEQTDHAPIEYAQVGHDKPLFLGKYRDPSWVMQQMCI